MVTLGEVVRFISYRLLSLYYRAARRMLRGDRMLLGSERRFRGLLESAPDAMVIVDWHGHITLVNAQAVRLFGHPRHELIGQSIGVLIPQRLRARHREHVKGFLRHASTRPMGSGLELAGLRADGSEFPVEISLSPLETEEGVLVSAAIRDISERKRAVRELAEAEELFRGAFDGSPIGMALTDGEGRIVRINTALTEILGYQPEQLEQCHLGAFTHPDHLVADGDALTELLGGHRSLYKTETRLVHGSGHALWIALQATVLGPGHPGEGRRLLLQVQDITYRKRYEDNLHFLANHDALTGLHNRASFARRLASHAEYVRRYGAGGAVLLLDLDHFKYVNDTLGHQAGDQLIARVARVLQDRLRESDVLARIGGDEFAALLPRADGPAAQRVAEGLLDALRGERLSLPGQRERTMTASIGVALFDSGREGEAGEDVLVSADLAMYDAKEAGRNRVAMFRTDEHHQARMKGRVTWVERIAVAIEEERFALVAQPIIDFATNRATQFEVLLRMRSESGDDLIPPGAFLYIAERLGMVQGIDRLTVKHAIRAVAAADPALADTRVEINLSGASIGDPELLEVIEHELNASGLAPERVIFEITETAAVANIARAREFGERLSEIGCCFALDDFGAGFGSFYYLKHVPFDFLKIDGEFVREARGSVTDQLVIQAVVAIARGLGKRTIAEHVGDAATVDLLRELGVDYGQGFHLARPTPLERYLHPNGRQRALPD